MVMLDANMILRYLLNDNAEMAETAEKYINSGNVIVTIEVIAEVIYILKGVYNLDRDEITETVNRFVDLVNCPEPEVLHLAVETFGDRNIDFVDCVLYAYHKSKNIEIATFDKKLLKMINE